MCLFLLLKGKITQYINLCAPFIFHHSSSSLLPLLLSVVNGKREYIEIKIEINGNSRNSLSLVWLKSEFMIQLSQCKKRGHESAVTHLSGESFLSTYEPHLLRETNFTVQRDFNLQSTTIPLNLHYMWPAGRGENNSKVRHKAIHNSLISNASKALPVSVLCHGLWSFHNYI